MSNILFFDGDIVSKEKKKKNDEIRKEMNSAAGRYTDGISYKSFTDEETFDFGKNKKEMVDNLNWLQSLEVEEFTFLKKFEEIQSTNDFIKGYETRARSSIWTPTDINNEASTIREINNLQPEIVVVNDSSNLWWTTLRIHCSTAEYNQAPGRFIKF